MQKPFTQIGTFGEDENITIRADFDTWSSIVDDLRAGASSLEDEVKNIERDIADPNKADTGTPEVNAPFLEMFRETIATRRHRAEALSVLVDGE